MDTAPSPDTIDPTRIVPFYRHLIAHAVPEMMDLAKEELEGVKTVGVLPPEVTPEDVVAMVLEDVLPRLHPDVGLPWGTIMLQCALLDRLAELTDCEMGIPPTITALAS